MLMTALRVFEALHAAVYARLPQAPLSADPEASGVWDVRNVLAAEKKRVSCAPTWQECTPFAVCL